MSLAAREILLEGDAEISKLVAERLRERRPFSLVRLGDGEGMLIALRRRNPPGDYRYLAGHVGPEAADWEHLSRLRERLLRAAGNADVLGIRDDVVGVEFDAANLDLPEAEFMQRFRSAFTLRSSEKDLPYAGCRRIASLHQALTELAPHAHTRFCSAWIHYRFHLSGAVFGWLRSQKRVGVITSRDGVPGRLEHLLDVRVRHIGVPGMYRDLAPEEERSGYLERLEAPLSMPLVEFPGMLYLVGAGLYGKLYCDAVRRQGGIAVDVGALFDAWLGIPTRPAVYRTLSPDPAERSTVPTELRLTAENIGQRGAG